MERLIKNCGVFLCALAFVFSLTGCGQDNQTVASVVNAIDADAVSVLQNIRTTQYFTDEAVAQKDIETIVQASIDGYSAAAILLIGHEDTSVDKNVDSYTGATTRNPESDMVTYIAAN